MKAVSRTRNLNSIIWGWWFMSCIPVAVFSFLDTKKTSSFDLKDGMTTCSSFLFIKKQESGGACKSAWGNGDKRTLMSYQREVTRKKGFTPTHRWAFYAETLCPLIVCLCLVINTGASRGSANYHSTVRTNAQGNDFRQRHKVIERN